jgi:5-methylcytosine-specific restriction endonuclease McrA
MKQRGKRAIAWEKTRREWLRDNPPNFEGYYVCYICSKWILAADVTLDHVIARSKRPDLLTDMTNLRPCCGLCNSMKGST